MNKNLQKLKKMFRKENKTEYIALRVAPVEKTEIQQAAKEVELSLSEYLLTAHRFVNGSE